MTPDLWDFLPRETYERMRAQLPGWPGKLEIRCTPPKRPNFFSPMTRPAMKTRKKNTKKKPEQGILLDAPQPDAWNVVTVEVKNREEHRLRWGTTVHETGKTPHDLGRLQILAKLHNERGLGPREKVECLADIGGNLDSALKAQNKAAERRETEDRRAREKWWEHFTHLEVTTPARGRNRPNEEVEELRLAGKTPLEAIAHFLTKP